MSFLFIYICDLLEKLEEPHLFDVPLLPAQHDEYANQQTVKWLKLHNSTLSSFGINSGALVSMLRPEKVVDRDYGLDTESLELVIARVLQVSRTEFTELQRWRTNSQTGDLGKCASRLIETGRHVSSVPIYFSRPCKN